MEVDPKPSLRRGTGGGSTVFRGYQIESEATFHEHRHAHGDPPGARRRSTDISWGARPLRLSDPPRRPAAASREISPQMILSLSHELSPHRLGNRANMHTAYATML